MKIRHITSGLQFPEGPVAMDDGSVLLVEIARGTLSRVTPDGRIHVVAQLGGGPNGAAIGPDGAVYVCNNGGFEYSTELDGCLRPTAQARDYAGGRIERVDLATGRFERLFDAVDGIGLRGPNDIVFDAQGGFYFTDLGKSRAHEMDHGGVYYAPAPGGAAQAIARPAAHAQRRGAVAGRPHAVLRRDRGRRLWAFDIESPGRVRKLPWPSPQRRTHAGGLAGRAFPALRFDGRRRARQPARRHADAWRHQRRSRQTAAATTTCRWTTASSPTCASAGAICARSTSRCPAAAG